MKRSKAWLYFLQEGANGLIKIGVSKSFSKRLRSLQTGNPRKLRVLCVVVGDQETEQQLHKRYDGARVAGEWFKPIKALLAEIRQIAKSANAVPLDIARVCTF